MYRITRKAAAQREKLAAIRRARDATRTEAPAPDYPRELPDLRREIIVIDHDFGTVTHHFRFFRCDRIDCYRIDVDGRPWQDRMGWSRALALLREALPRVGASCD